MSLHNNSILKKTKKKTAFVYFGDLKLSNTPKGQKNHETIKAHPTKIISKYVDPLQNILSNHIKAQTHFFISRLNFIIATHMPAIIIPFIILRITLIF